MRRIGWGIAGITALAALATFVVTGTAHLPTRLALGPCLPDFTSMVTYQPRMSPLATLDIPLAAGHARLCYGRPSARGRPIYGGLVSYGEAWRLGANEPTRLYTDRELRLPGLMLAPGRYSLYAVPSPERWAVHVTRSVTHWGNDLSAAVRAQDVGAVDLAPTSLPAPAETLTVTTEQRGDSTWLHFDWATTRVTLPLVPAGAALHE